MEQTPETSRILEIAPEDMTEAQKAGVEALLAGRGRLLAPYKIWMHSPGLMMAMEQLGTFLNKASSLTEREVELGICLAAHHWAGDYVFASHANRCVSLGFPRTVLEDIRAGRRPDLPDMREDAVVRLAAMSVRRDEGMPDDFEFILSALGRDGLAEAICLFGYYTAVAIGMKLHRVPPKPF